MKVSLVIPTYNEEKYLKNCLISVMAQTQRPDEILIVDNNSTDNTIRIAKEFPVTILHEKKQGITPARNRGFDAAQYEVIARCDADAKLSPGWIQRIKHDFEHKRVDALTGPFAFYDLKLKTTYLSTFYLDVVKPILNGNEILIGPNMALTKEIWNKVRNDICLDDKKVHEDIDLAIHITFAGGKILRDKQMLVHISGRRVKHNPLSFFGEYPLRLLKTLSQHKKDLISPFLNPDKTA